MLRHLFHEGYVLGGGCEVILLASTRTQEHLRGWLDCKMQHQKMLLLRQWRVAFSDAKAIFQPLKCSMYPAWANEV